jgi:NADPH:quinone reductase-like Zn-dependent oxidoreductase
MRFELPNVNAALRRGVQQETMRALVATGNQADPLEMREVDPPKAAPNEILLQTKAMSINRGELRLLASRPAGWRPGQDISGEVLQPAVDGSGPPPGTRVVALVDQAGWAEQVAVPTSRLGPLDDGVTYAEAATLPVAGLTALRALRLGGTLLGKKVLVTGASGGVGQFAVQLAARSGADVTGTSRTADRAQSLLTSGDVKLVSDLNSLQGPYDLILESVGGESLTAALKHVARDGKVIVFGNSSGQDSSISFGSFAGRAHATVYAFFVYESGEPPTFGADLALLASEVAACRLNPIIGAQGSWSDPVSALNSVRERRLEGKAVLLIDS